MKKSKRKGNIAILMCIIVTVICGFSAFVIDIGIVYSEKAKLTKALDAAALAAVMELPSNPTKASAIAVEYLKKNKIDPNTAVLLYGDNNKSIEINSTKNVKHYLAQIIGIESSNVTVRTKAIVAPIKAVSKGIRPFAVEKYPFVFGQQVILKKGAGSGYHGNYSVIALGGSGAVNYENNALYGFNGTITVGDWIDTEPGNMMGATNQIKNYISSENSTFDTFQRDSIKLWTIPLVNTLLVNGRNQIQVTGFGEFFVENAKNSGGEMELTGRFIKYVVNGKYDASLEDTGLYSSKLIE